MFDFIRFTIYVVSFALALFSSSCSQSSAYDASKAPFLTEEKRRQYDIKLANELETYNFITERCPYNINDQYKLL